MKRLLTTLAVVIALAGALTAIPVLAQDVTEVVDLAQEVRINHGEPPCVVYDFEAIYAPKRKLNTNMLRMKKRIWRFRPISADRSLPRHVIGTARSSTWLGSQSA